MTKAQDTLRQTQMLKSSDDITHYVEQLCIASEELWNWMKKEREAGRPGALEDAPDNYMHNVGVFMTKLEESSISIQDPVEIMGLPHDVRTQLHDDFIRQNKAILKLAYIFGYEDGDKEFPEGIQALFSNLNPDVIKDIASGKKEML